MRGLNSLLLTGVLALCATASHAGEIGEVPAISVAYNAGILSDYRFRGLSYTSREPAVQGGVDLSFRSGFFLGSWASNVADTGGSNVEVDLYGGYGGSLAGFDYTAGAYGYVYPGGHDVNYVELQSTIARTIGPVTTKLTVAYTPDQGNTDDNLYLHVGGDVAIIGTPLTVSAGIGRENGSYDHKYDWSAGVAYVLDALVISATYVDTNYKGVAEAGHNGRAGLVLSVKTSF